MQRKEVRAGISPAIETARNSGGPSGTSLARCEMAATTSDAMNATSTKAQVPSSIRNARKRTYSALTIVAQSPLD